MQKYEAYLFDWDGTLAQTVPIWVEIIRAHLLDYGVVVSSQQVAALYGDYTSPIKLGLPAALNDTFHAELVPLAAAELPKASLYEGAANTLTRLKQASKKLALISSSRRESIDLLLVRFGLDHIFDVIISQQDIRTHKPDPEGILRALTQFDLEPSKALVLGDTANDLKAAANAHVDSLLFHPPANADFYDFSALQALHPTYIIHSWHELSERV